MRISHLISVLQDAIIEDGDREVFHMSEGCAFDITYLGRGSYEQGPFFWITSDDNVDLTPDEKVEYKAPTGPTLSLVE